MTRIAIIGGGMAGLHLACRLQDKAAVTVFEKSRGVSGRLATRRIGAHEFDHGAQFFTARSQAFRDFLAPYMASGIVQPWQPRVLTLARGEKPYRRDWFEPHYVAVPRMTALCKSMAQSQDIRLQTLITAISTGAGPPRKAWSLHTADGPLPDLFDWVVSTAPLPQTRRLFAGLARPDRVLSGEGDDEGAFSPCYTLMLGFQALPALPFDAARIKQSAIDWISLNHTRPGRPASPALVVQSTHDWAEAHLETPDDRVTALLRHDLDAVLERPLPQPGAVALHRWCFAKVTRPAAEDFYLDPDARLAACGDGFLDSRVEDAFLSAHRLADALENHL